MLGSSTPGLDERNQLLEVVVVVVVARDAFAVVDDPRGLVPLEAVQEVPLAEPARELAEGARLELGARHGVADARALVAVREPSLHRARPHLAGGGVRAGLGLAAVAFVVLRAQTAGEPAPRDSQLSPHEGPLVSEHMFL